MNMLHVYQSRLTLCDPMDCSLPDRLLCLWGFSRQEYWNRLPYLLNKGFFPNQGSNLGLLHCRQILYHLSTREAPTINMISSKLNNNSRRWVQLLLPFVKEETHTHTHTHTHTQELVQSHILAVEEDSNPVVSHSRNSIVNCFIMLFTDF